MPVDKEALKGSNIKPDSKEWDDTYAQFEERINNAAAVLDMDEDDQDRLIQSASSSKRKRGRPDVKPKADQLNEIGYQQLYANQAYMRTWEKHKDVTAAMTEAEDGKDGKDGKDNKDSKNGKTS